MTPFGTFLELNRMRNIGSIRLSFSFPDNDQRNGTFLMHVTLLTK